MKYLPLFPISSCEVFFRFAFFFLASSFGCAKASILASHHRGPQRARGKDKKENFLLRSFNDGHKLKWKWEWVFSYRRKCSLRRVCLLHVVVSESFDWLKKFHLPQQRQEMKLDSPHKWAAEEEVELEAKGRSESFSLLWNMKTHWVITSLSQLAGWICTRVRAVRKGKK